MSINAARGSLRERFILLRRVKMVKIGLVLSGGLAKGAYQIGALQASGEFFKPDDFACVSAASVGLLNAYAYVSGQLDAARDAWLSAAGDGRGVLVTEIIRNSGLRQTIKELTAAGGPVAKDLYFPLFNYNKRKTVYFNLRDIPFSDYEKFLSAGIAIPLYNKACVIGDEKFYDGAIADNIPVAPLLNGCDFLICVCFHDGRSPAERTTDKKTIRLTFSGTSSLSDSFAVRRDSVEFMIGEGNKQAKKILDFVFCRGIADTDMILKRIGELNGSGLPKVQFPVTADHAIHILNKAASVFNGKNRTD